MQVVKGISIALLSSLFAAILFAFIFRIPIPLGEYIGPFGKLGTYNANILETIKSVVIAWMFYGILGGFIVIPVFGAIVATIVDKIFLDPTEKNNKIFIFAVCSGVLPVFIISILEYFIGPW